MKTCDWCGKIRTRLRGVPTKDYGYINVCHACMDDMHYTYLGWHRKNWMGEMEIWDNLMAVSKDEPPKWGK